MDEKTAIEILIKFTEIERRKIDDSLSEVNSADGGWVMMCDALDLAISALSRQVPMKPVMRADAEDEWVYCPVCNKQVGTPCWYLGYCIDCGQRIEV